ncbi:MAG: polysaccharide deacetylase family protein [Phormidesmis sp.]
MLPLDTLPTLGHKNRALRFLHLCCYGSGLSSLYARLNHQLTQDSVATILMYHSIPAPGEDRWMDPCNCISAEVFEQHMQFLAKHRHVVSIEQLTQQLKRQDPIRLGTVAITFDDGYRNNFTVAAPILAKYNLPATIYLATAYVEASKNQWIDTLYVAFRTRSRHRLCLPQVKRAAGQVGGKWDLSQRSQRQAAYRAIAHYLIEATVQQRQTLLTSLDAQLAPRANSPRLTLNWDEVRQMQQQYPNITLGVHTANHIDLHTHSEQTTYELKTSIEHLTAATGISPQHLAFPYNRYNAQSQAQAAKHLSSAVAVADDPVVRAGTSCYALPRLEAPHSLLLLKSWTNGGFPHILRGLVGRAWTQPY